MRIVVRTKIPEDASLRDQWNKLVQNMESPQVFYTYEWALAVSSAYAASLRPLLISAYKEGTLAGVVALALDAAGKQVSFLTSSTADYCDFVSTPADRQKFVEEVMLELRRMAVTEIRLANLPADSASARAMQSATRQASYSVFSRPAYLCAQVPLGSSEERAQARKSARNKLKRMSNAAAEHGKVTVSHHVELDELAEELTEFATAHVQRFLSAGRISNLVRSERRAFLSELALLLSAQGWLAMSTLKLQGRTVAWNYGFKFGGNWFWYQPAFDNEFGELSPGSYLLCEILRRAADDPAIHTVDLGLGDEDYKQRYAKSGRATLYVTAMASKRQKAWEVCRYRASALVKRSSWLEQVARKCNSQVSSFRERSAKEGIAACARYCFSRIARSLSASDEVLFFERVAAEVSPASEFSLQPISAKLLASAAMEYQPESDTLDYILRSAKRLQSHGAHGFLLVTSAGVSVHFCWVARFQGFRMAELAYVLDEPAPQSILLLDCWTPQSQRGQGHYGRSISLVADRMIDEGKRPWIFSATTNTSSLRGIEKAGFVSRFSLVRRKRLLINSISKVDLGVRRSCEMDLHPAA